MKHATVSFLGATALFALLTAAMTWPQARQLSTHAVEHQDVYFNMWRLGWIAHALASPARLFDGNVFYPEARVLTFSDAILVEGFVAAPLLWSGLPRVLVHNLVLLGGIVLSGSGVFVLVRRLTTSTAAAIVAGTIFAFAPYRFEHVMHMELQWALWSPWAFWALDRTVDTGRWRDGAMTGVFIALQFMSSIYYGVFLATLLAPSALLLLASHRRHWRRATASLAAGALLGAALCVPYAVPYLQTRKAMGGRSAGEISTYSARPFDYLSATPDNYLYGESAPRAGRSERRLFPGVLAVLLALTALTVSHPPVRVFIYLLAMVAAFELSLGVRGYSYPILYQSVPGFDSLRAPARLGIFVLLFISVLAAYGYAAVEQALRPRLRVVMVAAAVAVLMLEYWVAPLRLVPYPSDPAPVYAWLSEQPRGVVAEFPIPAPDRLPGDDARYGYMSTFHWQPTINGYSGYYPRSYLDRLARLASFPDERATRELHRADVTYVVIHRASYAPGEANAVIEAAMKNPAYAVEGSFGDGVGAAVVLRLRQ